MPVAYRDVLCALAGFAIVLGLAYGVRIALMPGVLIEAFGTKDLGAMLGIFFTATGVAAARAARWLAQSSTSPATTGGASPSLWRPACWASSRSCPGLGERMAENRNLRWEIESILRRRHRLPQDAPMKERYIQFAGYNAWANRRIYDVAATLSDDEYRADKGAFFKSMHGTLNHLLVTDWIWMQRFTGEGDAPDAARRHPARALRCLARRRARARTIASSPGSTASTRHG